MLAALRRSAIGNLNCSGHGYQQYLNSNVFCKSTRRCISEMSCSMGVSVQLPLDFENRKLIFKLVQSLDYKTNPQLSCGVYDESRESNDNVKRLYSDHDDESYKGNLEQLQNTSTEQHFDSKCQELLANRGRPVFNFLYTAGEAELINLMKRSEVDFYFHKESESPTAMKKKLDDGVKFFKKFGVKASKIRVGFSIDN